MAAAGLLASCALAPTSSGTKFSEAEYGVKASPRVASGANVPKGGGRAMVGKPYRVAGKTYVPRDDPNYSASGLASWYGPNFHGRKTANGEVFDMHDLTAAHPTLPLPSYVRVTNLGNGRSVVVRVNDRGPFTRGRVIDVSSTAASMLDFKRAGVAKVKVDYIGPARMDGHDRDVLMASYRGPDAGTGTMVAARQPAPAVKTITVAEARRMDPAPRGTDALAIGPTPTAFDDPIGPLILRSGFVNSYAAADRLTPAHTAAADLASGEAPRPVQTARTVVARPGDDGTLVQLGAFSDPANAARVAKRFERFGKVVLSDRASGSGPVRVVIVVLRDPAVSPQAVIDAASSAGLSGAFVVSR